MSNHGWRLAVCLGLLSAASCAKVAVEGGDKPIKIQMDVTFRVANELENFFAFENKAAPATQPATAPAATGPVAAGE